MTRPASSGQRSALRSWGASPRRATRQASPPSPRTSLGPSSARPVSRSPMRWPPRTNLVARPGAPSRPVRSTRSSTESNSQLRVAQFSRSRPPSSCSAASRTRPRTAPHSKAPSKRWRPPLRSDSRESNRRLPKATTPVVNPRRPCESEAPPVAHVEWAVHRGGTVAAYVIYQGEVRDPARYDEYKAKAAASILAAGGKYVVRGGDIDVLEGEAPAGRTVVLEFPTRQAAIDWYRSEAYAAARQIREGAAVARMYVVDGVSAPEG